MQEFTKSYAIKRIAELTEQIEELRSLYSALMKDCQLQIEEYNKIKNQLAEQPKQIIEKIIEKYNLNRKPIIDNFGNVDFGYAMINADKLKEFLDNLLKEMK